MQAKFLTPLFICANIFAFSNQLSADSLDIAVFKTLAENPEIMAEINRKSARQQELRQAESGYYPSVDILAAVGNENTKNRYTLSSGSTGFVDLTRKEAALVVTYNLFDGFGTSSNINKNSAKVSAAGHYLHQLTEQTALQVANVYLQVLRHQELVKLSQATLNVHEKLFKKVRSRSLSGVGRKSDINQAMGRVARARANLIAEEANLRSAESSYLRVIGELPGGLIKPANWDNKIPEDITQAIDLALNNNPLLKAAKADIDVANAQRTETKSGHYPKLDVVFEQSRGENLDGYAAVEEDYSLMLKMKYNLFKGGYDVARSKQATYQLNESKDKYNDSKRKITESMQLAWNAYQSVKMQLPYLRQHVKSIKATRRAYTDQFKIGRRSLLDLLDSENELYQSNRSNISAEYDYLISSYRILAHMGKFVDELEANRAK